MLLKLGSQGEDVKKLQTRLGLNPDGNFGQLTEAKVKDWQSKNGLKADGIVGEVTWAKLFGVLTEDVVIAKNVEIPIENLVGHIPNPVLVQLPEVMEKFDISNPLRLTHFLSQCSHESGGFRLVVENLNYTADALKRVFPKYFPGNLAESYEKQPEKIASRVYGGRMGNGQEGTKDGFKYRGRGYIQLTGRENYVKFSRFIGEDVVNNPDLVATKYPLASAAFFFKSNGLWPICDRGSDDATIILVTKRINGGTIGLEHRIYEFRKIYKILT